MADHEFDKRSSVHYTGYAYKLSDDEMGKLKAHIKLFSKNQEYADAAVAATHGETTGLEFVPFAAIKDEKFSSEHFTYWPHYKAYHKVVRLFEEEKGKSGTDLPDIGTPMHLSPGRIIDPHGEKSWLTSLKATRATGRL